MIITGSAPKNTGGSQKVGISMPTKSLQRWNQDGSNMKSLFEAAGYEVDLQYGGDSLTEVLAPAKSKGIPVIAYDRLIMGTDALPITPPSTTGKSEPFKVHTLKKS